MSVTDQKMLITSPFRTLPGITWASKTSIAPWQQSSSTRRPNRMLLMTVNVLRLRELSWGYLSGLWGSHVANVMGRWLSPPACMPHAWWSSGDAPANNNTPTASGHRNPTCWGWRRAICLSLFAMSSLGTAMWRLLCLQSSSGLDLLVKQTTIGMHPYPSPPPIKKNFFFSMNFFIFCNIVMCFFLLSTGRGIIWQPSRGIVYK